jgi:hypothetical protein
VQRSTCRFYLGIGENMIAIGQNEFTAGLDGDVFAVIAGG